jgi:DNA-binding MarR family transcriptional regulator
MQSIMRRAPRLAGGRAQEKPSFSFHVPSVSAGFALWRTAMRWQRSVDAALAPVGLTHTQFLVLNSASQLEAAKQDAFSQRALAEDAGLDEATTSRIVRTLEARGMLDRGPTFDDHRAWRVRVTRQGRSALRQASACVERAHKHFLTGMKSG